jgi:hypothetical protein
MKVFDKFGHLKTLPGAQGPAGAGGANGAEGPEGPQGPQGDPGPTGASWRPTVRVDGSATITVTVDDYYVVATGATTINLPDPGDVADNATVWLALGEANRELVIQDSTGTLFDITVTSPSIDDPATLVLGWDGSQWQTLLRIQLATV